MLGKLVKYEFKATYKFMLMLYGILIVMSLFTGFGNRIRPDNGFKYPEHYADTSVLVGVLNFLVAFLFGAMMFVVITAVFFYYINRFRKNMLGDSGYLYHTLPVNTHDHIIAKCLSAVFWTLTSFIVAAVSYIALFAIIYSGIKGDIWFEIYAIIDIFLIYFSDHIWFYILQLVLFVLNLLVFYLQIFASMAVGYSSNNHRAIKSVGVFVLIMFVGGFIASFFDEFTEYTVQRTVSGVVVFPEYSAIAVDFAISALAAVALFFITRYFLKNKLNLQ